MAPRWPRGIQSGAKTAPRWPPGGGADGRKTALRPLQAGSKSRQEVIALRFEIWSEAKPEMWKKNPLIGYRNRGIDIYIYIYLKQHPPALKKFATNAFSAATIDHLGFSIMIDKPKW